jgi:hypothetical protein
MLWSELVQGQSNYQSSRSKLVGCYQTNSTFRDAVQFDNSKRNGQTDPIPAGTKVGAAPLPSDMFVLEEVGLFHGLAHGHVRSGKIDPITDLVLAYPGPLMQSLRVIEQDSLKVYKGRPSEKRDGMRNVWLDISSAEKLVVQEFNSSSLEYDAKPYGKSLLGGIFSKKVLLTSAAAAVLALTAVLGHLFNSMKRDVDNTIVIQNDYQSVVRYKKSGGEIEVTYKKSATDGNWTASSIKFDPKDAGRPLLFRDDVSYIQDAGLILARASTKAR